MAGKSSKSVKNLFCAVILALFSTGCAKATLVDSNSVIRDGIEYYIQTDKSVYDLGENVQILYRITNLTHEEWRVFGISPLRMIFVSPEDSEWFESVWDWFEPGPPGPTGFTLQPNESTKISEIWAQINMQATPYEPADDTQVPQGTYRITARLKPTDTNVAVNVTVVPEPASLVLFLAGLGIANYVDRRKRR